jgi:hypothetical protein
VDSPTRSPTGSSRDRSWAPSPSTITTRALSPVTSARLTRPSTASPGTSFTPTRPARRNHSSRPSRRPPDRDPGMSICITDGSIQLAHPLPAKVFCSTCGTSYRWSGRNCISDAIRHFQTFHGKSVNVLVECSYCCNISKTVQAAFFHQEKACPGLALPDQLDSTSPAGETQLMGDKVILVYPPRPSKCPLCSWTCLRTRADANGTPTTGVVDGIISHLYTRHNGIKATRFWRCSKCLVLGEGMAMHHHHRYPIEDVDNDHPAEAFLSSTDYPSD